MNDCAFRPPSSSWTDTQDVAGGAGGGSPESVHQAVSVSEGERQCCGGNVTHYL